MTVGMSEVTEVTEVTVLPGVRSEIAHTLDCRTLSTNPLMNLQPNQSAVLHSSLACPLQKRQQASLVKIWLLVGKVVENGVCTVQSAEAVQTGCNQHRHLILTFFPLTGNKTPCTPCAIAVN